MSKSASWFPFYPADYMGSTRRLTTIQHGAYLLLLIEQWHHGDLPDDDAELARIAGMRIDHWKRIAPRIRAHFVPGAEAGTLRQPRLHAERLKAEGLVAKRAGAANARWGNRTTTDEQSASTSERHKSLDGKDNRDAPAHAEQSVCTSQLEPHEEKGSLRSPSASAAGGAADLFGAADRKANRRKRPNPGGAPVGPGRAPRTEAVAVLAEMTGKPVAATWPLFSRWVQDCEGDTAAVCGFVAEAKARGVRRPVPFITACVQNRAKRALETEDPMAQEAGGYAVSAVVGHCNDIAEVCLEGLWPDFPRLVLGALASGAVPHEHIYPVVKRVRGRVVSEVQSVGYFAAGFRDAMGRRNAA